MTTWCLQVDGRFLPGPSTTDEMAASIRRGDVEVDTGVLEEKAVPRRPPAPERSE